MKSITQYFSGMFVQWLSLMAPVCLLILLLASGCKKEPQIYVPVGLTVGIPAYGIKHDLYYQIPYTVRSVELAFSEVLDTTTVAGNIQLADHQGICDGEFSVLAAGDRLLMVFHPGFTLRDGWRYRISIQPGLRTVSGNGFPDAHVVEFRTTQWHPDLLGTPPGDSILRETILVISDIHMGDARSIEKRYGWFGENGAALADLLDEALAGEAIRQVVVLGDLLDEWIVPYSMPPFDSASGVSNSATYFQMIATNPVNAPVIDKLRAIAASGEMELIYVPGNHDMLLTREVLEGLIPGVIWKGDTTGLGKYIPEPEIVMEHGHRYDFFNCPQPLVSQGHILPPGYFISRLYAQANMEHPGMLKSGDETSGSFEFTAAWDIAIAYTLYHFGMLPPDFLANTIRMSGIDGYTQMMSFHGTKLMYAPNIEAYWPATQTVNRVAVPSPCCIHAIWNGHSDLFSAAQAEYMEQPPAPVAYKIVAFGHTHEPMLKVYPTGSSYTSVYANSGSWVDEGQSSHAVRTYLLITPGAWSGSALDVVSLYQYNPDAGGGWKPTLLAEESVEK